MRIRACAMLGVLLLTGIPVRGADASKNTGPMLVLQIRSVGDVVADISYLAGLAGQEEQAKQFQEMIKAVGGANGLKGIDTKKPIGVYKNDVASPSGVVMVPVTDTKAFLDLLSNVGQQAEKGADDIYSIALELPHGTVYFRFANKYVYASFNDKDILTSDLLKPAAVFKSDSTALLSATVRMDQIPANVKELVLSQVDAQLDTAKQQKDPGETAAQHKLKGQILSDFGKRFHRGLEDGKSIEFSLDIDRHANRVRASASLTGVAGSKLAANIRDLASVQSMFGGAIGTDSALNLRVRASTPANVRADFESAVQEGMRQALQHEKDEGKRRVAERILKALTPTIVSGELDTFVNLRGPSDDKLYTLVAASRLTKGLEVEHAFEQTIRSAPPADRAKIHVHAEKIGDVQVTRIDTQTGADAGYRRTFGKHPAYVAFRDDAVFAAVGPHALDALKQAMEAQPQAAPVFELTLNAARLVPLIAQSNPQVASLGGAALQGANGEDKVQVRVRGGAALKLDVTVQSGALKLLGQLAAKKRAAAEKESDQ